MSILLLLIGTEMAAYALPQQLSQQGRLIDTNGIAVTGQHDLTFRLYDDALYGYPLWLETVTATFNSGYYSVILGADSANPIDVTTLQISPLYLEMEVDGGGALEPRQEIHAAPYARMATTAESLIGGSVSATEISIGGTMVIDGNGSWVGPTIALNWADLSGIPADLTDGDDDTLASLSCNLDQIVTWNGSVWVCVDNNGLSEAEVEQFITNGPLDFAAGSTLGGLDILTTADQGVSLADLSCQNGELPKYDSALGWQCDLDNDTSDWSALANVPAGFADGIDDDTQLSEGDVEGFVINGLPAFDLSTGTTLGGDTILTSTACADGEFLSYQSATSTWVCANLQGALDADGDGIMAWDDCDDTDPASNAKSDDADCDGVLSGDDCDDGDANSTTTIAMDADCDGVLTANDCDDDDSTLGDIGLDADCDGVSMTVDCDDNDSYLGDINLDGDCDGTLFSDDCDDNNAILGDISLDTDCDGTLNASDCDPNDSSITDIDGSSGDCAAESCKAIMDDGFSTGTGYYFIKPSGSSSAVRVKCNMDYDGGGWTMVWGDSVSELLLDGSDYNENSWYLTQTAIGLNGNVDCGNDPEGVEMSLSVNLNPTQMYMENVTWIGTGGGDRCEAFGGQDGFWISSSQYAANNSVELFSFAQSDNLYATCYCSSGNNQSGYSTSGYIYVR